MLSTILYCTIAIVVFTFLYQIFLEKSSIKESLDSTSSSNEKQTDKQTDEQKKQQQRLALARAQATPSQINASNVKYLDRTFQDIENDISDIKTLLYNAFTNIKNECCSLNKHNKNVTCNKSKNLSACKNKNPCTPCKKKNPVHPFSCCQTVDIPK